MNPMQTAKSVHLKHHSAFDTSDFLSLSNTLSISLHTQKSTTIENDDGVAERRRLRRPTPSSPPLQLSSLAITAVIPLHPKSPLVPKFMMKATMVHDEDDGGLQMAEVQRRRATRKFVDKDEEPGLGSRMISICCLLL
ncbi:hypothetical protein ACS0TY_021728 [Phlomoides rotata]